MAKILVDTNVLSDVLYADRQWYNWSSSQLENFGDDLAINPIIYADICYRAASIFEAESIMRTIGLQYLELPPHP